VEAPESKFDGDFDLKEIQPLKESLAENHERIAPVIMEPNIR
jgi:adenosylmethionine-8-amino-7-oxononanoate aminotransferase